MITIKIIESLIYYDGVELFLGEDALDIKYLCLHVESGDIDKYLCAPISRKRLYQFYHGETDLQSIFKSPESNTLYTLTTNDLSESKLVLEPLAIDELSDEWLPEPGFIFERTISEEIVVKEAYERNRAVIHLSLNPPESRDESKIATDRLIEFLKTFQSALKHSYRKSLSSLNSGLREKLDKSEYFETEIFSFSPDSFTVHLQSKTAADFLGYVELVKALDIFDEITSVINDPKEALEVLTKNKGHLVNSYKKLLNLVIENNTPLKYSWSYPEKNEPKIFKIDKNDAIPILDLMSQRKELEVETVELIGRLVKADVKNGNWTIKLEETGKEFRGKIPPGSEISLSGLVLEAQVYNFSCQEKIEHEIVSGKEITTYWLQAYKKIP